MSAEISKTFQLSDRLSVELSVSSSGISAAWRPSVPNRLTPAELRRYREARGEMLQRLAEKLGGAVVVVEA